jgi:hypothetical protein
MLPPPDSKRAAFVALQQNHADQQQGQDQVDGKDDGFHGRAVPAGIAGAT